MTGKRTKRIIAVFGGSKNADVLALAEEFGRIIAEEKQILLTGGTGPAKDSVKNSAILGVGSSPWVGIDRKTSVGAEWSKEPERGFLIRSDLDHKRNYLEACLCDAAIGLKGDKGTLSEVTCSLSLQRPVAFVGDHWKGVCDLDADRSRARNLLVDATLKRFDESRGSNALDLLLTLEVIRGGLDGLLRYKYFDSRTTAIVVVGWIKSVLPDAEGFAGHFPSVKGHETVAAPYEEWLTEHAV